MFQLWLILQGKNNCRELMLSERSQNRYFPRRGLAESVPKIVAGERDVLMLVCAAVGLCIGKGGVEEISRAREGGLGVISTLCLPL